MTTAKPEKIQPTFAQVTQLRDTAYNKGADWKVFVDWLRHYAHEGRAPSGKLGQRVREAVATQLLAN